MGLYKNVVSGIEDEGTAIRDFYRSLVANSPLITTGIGTGMGAISGIPLGIPGIMIGGLLGEASGATYVSAIRQEERKRITDGANMKLKGVYKRKKPDSDEYYDYYISKDKAMATPKENNLDLPILQYNKDGLHGWRE